MEIVLLQDLVATYGSNWARIANAQGYDRIQIKDRFREQGFGQGAEEIEVEGIDLSPVGGASRIFFRRAANNTQAEVHKLGSVFLQTSGKDWTEHDRDEVLGDAALADPSWVYEPEIPDTIVAGGTEYANPAKRGRGRPKGSLNKPKQIPDWPSV